MLKKLLLILIVLVLSIPASATIISFEDEGAIITMTPGAVVTLYINATPDPGLMTLDALITISGGSATITGAMGDPDIIVPYPYPFGWDDIGEPLYGPGNVEIVAGMMTGANSGIIGYVEITYGSGTVVASLSNGTTWGGTFDYTGMPSTFSNGVVTLIPEPATLLFLALGAALLTKRR